MLVLPSQCLPHTIVIQKNIHLVKGGDTKSKSGIDTRTKSINDVSPLGAVWVGVFTTWEHLQDSSLQFTKIRVRCTKIDTTNTKLEKRVGEMNWIAVQKSSRSVTDEQGGQYKTDMQYLAGEYGLCPCSWVAIAERTALVVSFPGKKEHWNH